jgi:hypothetical protein
VAGEAGDSFAALKLACLLSQRSCVWPQVWHTVKRMKSARVTAAKGVERMVTEPRYDLLLID